MPAITDISRTGSSGLSRYTAPECAPTSSIIAASASDSTGLPTGALVAAGACAGPGASDTPTTSSYGRASHPRLKAPSRGRATHGERLLYARGLP